ncbi:TraR/DksA C4-type zinc finger protein [Yersinia intermedia]|uniref:TraR/DksA C4-type zinc finger protein n=1 Tax=Yersinia intermedia TaxID=631 RepID=UPI00065D4A73|nr:TraR/DksA C4-type zinc finger protein [Yersinia intermedia]CRY83996.1 Zinc-finger containing protein [Yersinia intermedia]
MADICDTAQQEIDIYLEVKINAVRSALARRESALNCRHCNQPIPEARRLAIRGTDSCVDCLTTQEQQQMHRNR